MLNEREKNGVKEVEVEVAQTQLHMPKHVLCRTSNYACMRVYAT